jgi:hypothetical protein
MLVRVPDVGKGLGGRGEGRGACEPEQRARPLEGCPPALPPSFCEGGATRRPQPRALGTREEGGGAWLGVWIEGSRHARRAGFWRGAGARGDREKRRNAPGEEE